MSCELVTIYLNGEEKEVVYVDNMCIHPNYRNKGLMNVIRKAIYEYSKLHNAQIFMGKSKDLSVDSYIVCRINLMNLALKDTSFSKLKGLDIHKYKIGERNIRIPSIEELSIIKKNVIAYN